MVTCRQPPQRRPYRRLVAADEFREGMPVILNDNAGDELRIGNVGLRHPIARLMRRRRSRRMVAVAELRPRRFPGTWLDDPRTTKERCNRFRRRAARDR